MESKIFVGILVDANLARNLRICADGLLVVGKNGDILFRGSESDLGEVKEK